MIINNIERVCSLELEPYDYQKLLIRDLLRKKEPLCFTKRRTPFPDPPKVLQSILEGYAIHSDSGLCKSQQKHAL